MLSIDNITPAFNLSSKACLIMDIDAPVFTIKYINPAYMAGTEISACGILGKGIFEVINEKNNKTINCCEFQTAVQHSLIFKVPYNISPYSEIYPILDNHNNVQFLVYIPECRFTDYIQPGETYVTENITIKQNAIKNEQRFKALVQEGSDLIAILSKEGQYLYVSPTSTKVLGIEPEFFIGKIAYNFIHEADRHRVINDFAQLVPGELLHISPYRFSDKHGKYRWIETIVTDMCDNPDVEGIIANSRDITLRIEQEHRIEASAERFDIVSKATSDAIYDWDFLAGHVVWNKGIRGIFGFKDDSPFTIKWWHNQIHKDDIEWVTSNIKSSIAKNESRIMSEYRFRCADGHFKTVLDRAFLVYNDDGHPIRMIGAIQDISERVNYIEAIENQNKLLRDISWMQSHLVRAPLANIMGLADLLCQEKGKTVDESLSLLQKSAIELDKIIRDIVKKSEII